LQLASYAARRWRRCPQHLVQPGLPARPARPEPLEDSAVEAQGDQLLRAAALGTANPPHETVAVINLGLRELRVGQLGRRVGVLGDLPRDLLIGRPVQASPIRSP